MKIINSFEYVKEKLPNEWREKHKELEEFLQNNWSLRDVFYDDSCFDSKQQFLEFDYDFMKAHNYIGTIVFNGVQFNIYPKIFKNFAQQNQLNNLLKINLQEWFKYYQNKPQFLSTQTQFDIPNNFKELFIIIFVNYLQNTLNKSGYFQYEEKTEDLSYITGRFDVQDYVCKKYPNDKWTKFKCTYSSFEFDNLLNRIIKYTCKLLASETNNDGIQLKLHQIRAKLNDVSDYTYTYRDCDRVKVDKMHQEYKIILWMCRMFLLSKTPSSIDSNNQSYCFLFPTEKLFEKFIGKFIEEKFKNNDMKIKLQEDGISLVDEIIMNGKPIKNSNCFAVKPDIICEDTINKKNYILDTKYKEVKSFDEVKETAISDIVKGNIKQNDLYQMIAYAIKYNSDKVCLIYPQYLGESNDEIMLILKFNYEDNKHIDIQLARVPFAAANENGIPNMELQLGKIISNILQSKINYE